MRRIFRIKTDRQTDRQTTIDVYSGEIINSLALFEYNFLRARKFGYLIALFSCSF